MSEPPQQSGSASSEEMVVESVLVVVREVVEEIRPGAGAALGVRARLSDDLGLDSLSRMELLRRIEERLQLALPERSVLEARDVSALVEVVLQKQRGGAESVSIEDRAAQIARPIPESKPRWVGFPSEVTTLTDALRFHVETQPHAVHVTFPFEEGTPQLTYAGFFAVAESAASFLLSVGVREGERVGIMLPTGVDFLSTYFGALLIRAVPVPIYPPSSLERLEEHLSRQIQILKNAGVTALVLPPEGLPFSSLLRAAVPSLRAVVTPQLLKRQNHPSPFSKADSSELALLQYTSGSTGQPKGVMLSHANLIANVRAMTEVLSLNERDVCVSWLPLYHDMGLIGAWLGSLVTGVPLVLMSPLSFISHPIRWLESISRYRGTISAGPNFAFQLAVDRIREEQLSGIDLSSWRIAFNGAEPVSANTIEQFSSRFAACGFQEHVMRPVYGLAESSLGVLFPREAKPPRIVVSSRAALQEFGSLKEVPVGHDTMRLVSCGEALPGHEVRIIDERGREAEEGHIGELQFAGASVTEGYFENAEATKQLLDGKWRNSGDFAARLGADIFVVGRRKDLIIRAGRNLVPQDVEDEAGQVEGVRRGCVVAFGFASESGQENFVIVAETKLRDPAERSELQQGIITRVCGVFDIAPDQVVLVPPRSIPKTSSGKLRRSDCKERFRRGTLGKQASGRQQLLLLRARAFLASSLRFTCGLPAMTMGILYGAWCWVCFLLLIGLSAPFVFACRSARLNRSFLRRVAQVLVRVCFVRLTVKELECLPKEACMIMSNHQSYADAVLLSAVLPSRFAFVAKRDFLNAPVFQALFPRIGVLWMERQNMEQSAQDLEQVESALKSGRSLVFFPEGGFWRDREILPFKMGGFVAAARAQVPIVPVAISGLRDLLPEGTWLPRRAQILVTFGVVEHPNGAEWAESVRLKNSIELQIKQILKGTGPQEKS